MPTAGAKPDWVYAGDVCKTSCSQGGLHLCECVIDSQAVTFYAQAGDDAFCDARQIRKMPERFAVVNIGNMYFNEGNRHARQGIPQCDAGMRQSTRIDDDGINAFGVCLMDAIDQFPFMITLKR